MQSEFPETTITPFHLAFPVDDLQAAREFYGGLLQCPEGRSSDTWIDFDLFHIIYLSGLFFRCGSFLSIFGSPFWLICWWIYFQGFSLV